MKDNAQDRTSTPQDDLLRQVIQWLRHYDHTLGATLPWHTFRQSSYKADRAIADRRAQLQAKAEAYLAFKRSEKHNSFPTHQQPPHRLTQQEAPTDSGSGKPASDRSFPLDAQKGPEPDGYEDLPKSMQEIRDETFSEIRKWVIHYRKKEAITLPWHAFRQYDYQAEDAIAARRAILQSRVKAYLDRST